MLPSNHLRHLLLCACCCLFCGAAVLIAACRLVRWLLRRCRKPLAYLALLLLPKPSSRRSQDPVAAWVAASLEPVTS